MTELGTSTNGTVSPRADSLGCPRWCVTGHGVQSGEEDWVHLSEPLAVADDVRAQLCMSVDPETGALDGPYFLIASSEYTLEAARDLGAALIAVADAAVEDCSDRT